MVRSSAPTGDNGRTNGSGEAELDDGTAYRPVRAYKFPSHNSKTVLSTVKKKGPPEEESNRSSGVNGGEIMYRRGGVER